jgi:hypothetical protein
MRLLQDGHLKLLQQNVLLRQLHSIAHRLDSAGRWRLLVDGHLELLQHYVLLRRLNRKALLPGRAWCGWPASLIALLADED